MSPPVAMLVSKIHATSGPCQSECPELPLEAMVTFWLGIVPRILPGSMVLSQLVSVLMSLAHDAIKGHTDAQGLGHNQ